MSLESRQNPALLASAGSALNLARQRPLIMGILNLTPDSACETGRYLDVSQAVNHAMQLIDEGADMIDIGAESTNPGVNPRASLEHELFRLIPVIQQLRRESDIPISIDTSKPEVMYQAIMEGASMINDVRALREPGAIDVVQKADVPVCLMHMRFPDGIPPEQVVTFDNDVLEEVKSFLTARRDVCLSAGIRQENIILDPGIGHGSFGKDTRQNLCLMKHMDSFLELGCPLLVCASRKTFIGKVLDISIAERASASIACAVLSALQGAAIIRVHDVKATVEAIKMTTAILEIT